MLYTPMYRDIIKQPMDLGTIAKRVQDDLYADNIEAFKKVRVIIMTLCNVLVFVYVY